LTVIERIGSDEDGLALARPVAWNHQFLALLNPPVWNCVSNGHGSPVSPPRSNGLLWGTLTRSRRLG